MRIRAINKKLVAFGLLLTCCGCGEAPTQPPTPQSTSANTATPEGKAEVSQAFNDFDSAVKEPASTPPTAQPQVETQLAQSTSQTQTAPKTTAKPAAPHPSIPAPTGDQLKRWTMEPFDKLQLLACRDRGRAGLVGRSAVIGAGESYVLAGNRLTTWAFDKEEPLQDFSDPANEQFVKSLGVSPDGKWIATGDGKGNLQIWELPDCKQRVAKKIYPSGVAHLSIAPDSLSIATSSFEGEVTIWDAAQLSPKNKFTVAKQALQNILFIAPNLLAVAAQDSSIWNTETGKQEHLLTTGKYCSTFALSADSKRLAYCNEGKMEFWSVQEGKSDGAIEGSFGRNDLAAFSPDGKYLVTANKLEINVWETASGRLVQVIDAFGWETSGLSWLPKSSLLMIASQNGRVRLWGNANTASALSWKPLHGSLELPNKDSGESVSPAQLMQVIDIRTFPRLPGATMVSANDMMLNYSAPATVDEVKTFYNYFFTRDGWSLVPDAAAGPDAMNFIKQDVRLSLYPTQIPNGPTQVNLSCSGNIDLRRLPKIDAPQPEIVYEADNTVMYRVKAEMLDIETTLIRKLFDAGWTSYARLNTSKNEEAERRDLQFIQGATTLLVSVQRLPDSPAYNVSYSKFLTTKSLPIPKDSGFIEFDGSTQPLMVASTAMTIEQTRDFFEKEMAAQGWLRRDSGKQFNEKSGWMEFIRGQCDVTMVLAKLESGRTQVRVGEGVENSSWQLKKSKPLNASVTENGIEAADVPALNGWSIVKYDSEQKQIDFVAKGATTFAFAEAYTKEFESRGWKAGTSGVKSEEYLLADFKKEKAELTLRATLRGGEIQATISGDGLLWAKPLPVAKQRIAYETWLRIHQHPATLDLLESYIAEMKAIKSE